MSNAAQNQRNDAEAIREAAGRPGMHFVPVKATAQQAQGMVLKIRETLVNQRTRLANIFRGHATEFGTVGAKGIDLLRKFISAIRRTPG